MATTMKEIAALAGVSRQVVSAVLRGSRTVKFSQKRREQILELVKNMNYRPSIPAMMLNGKPTRTVGFLVTHMHLPIFQELVNGLALTLAAKNYRLYLLPVHTTRLEVETINDFIQHGIDGFLYHSSMEEIRQENYSIPMLSIMGGSDKFDIAVDSEYGQYLAVRHLLAHGHRKISFIGNNLNFQHGKTAGYRRALLEDNIKPEDKWIISLKWNSEFASQIERLIKRDNVTAFAANCDFIAVRLISYLRNNGIKVPDDIAVTGFDGDTYANSCDCRITTIVQPMQELARRSIDLLMKKIEGKKLGLLSKPVLLKPTLHLGDSCGCHVPKNKIIYWEGFPPTIGNMNNFMKPLPRKLL